MSVENENGFVPEEAKYNEVLRDYLENYLEGGKDTVEKIKFIGADKLVGELRDEYNFLENDNLSDVVVAVVPENAWEKGLQPSESHVGKNLILFREDCFNNDKEAWLVHELSHCLEYKKDDEQYEKGIKKLAFEDIGSDVAYPNNKVEEKIFSRQLEYLKSKGVDKVEVVKMLKKYYGDKDFLFFNRLLNKVFG